MNVLVVKLSSLGDVVHAMPAVQDMRAALPGVQIDWVVEPGFAPLVRRCDGVRQVVECGLRRWRREPLSGRTRAEWNLLRSQLQAQAYDAVLDLQGLTKSAVVARLARLAPTGKRYALANRTEGSSYEAPTRWLADVAVPVQPRVHAVLRSRLMCAHALGYAFPAPGHSADEAVFGLLRHTGKGFVAPENVAKELATKTRPTVALVHGTSRADKLWPEDHWVQLGQRLLDDGYALALPHGSAEELARCQRLAQAWNAPEAVFIWPSLSLDTLVDALGACVGVVGVDSGLSHIAVALDLPHVQLYNFDTAWRTGPWAGMTRQRSVVARPTPSVAAVWQAWLAVTAGAPVLA